MTKDPTCQALMELGRGKDVLMLGPLGNYQFYRDGMLEHWDFKLLDGIAGTLVGLDVSAELVELARRDGFNILCGNAEDIQGTFGDRKFDLIYAPDLIEHLGNPQKCLECCAAALRDDGLIVMETPNPVSINVLLKALVTGSFESLAEHTCWIDKCNGVELARRARLKVRILQYSPISHYGFWQGVRTRLYKAVASVRPGLSAKTVFVFSVE